MAQDVEHGPLKAMVDQAVQAGGKRVRPILCLLGYRLFHEDYLTALPQAAAVEMFHAFSLVHDDIMDEAPTRRGLPSIYHAHGRDNAILTGDVMLILALQHVLKKAPADVALNVHATLSKVAIEVCEGQMMDMDFEKMIMPSREDYLLMIEKKTSVLLGAAIKIGAQVAGASVEACSSLYDYGLKQGLAFQVQDDFLDAFGDPQKTGKQPGGDIIQGKKTLLSILCAEAMGDGGEQIARLLNDKNIDDQDKVRQTLALYEKYDVADAVHAIKLSFMEEATNDLVGLDLCPIGRAELIGLSDWLLQRTH